MRTWTIYHPDNAAILLPPGEYSSFELLPEPRLEPGQAVDRLRALMDRFNIQFMWDLWDSVSLNPFIHRGKLSYWGVYGQTVVVEGQFYVNDVIDGDSLYISDGDTPFFCLHRDVFYTNDAGLATLAKGRAWPDDGAAPGPPGFVDREEFLLYAALYALKRSGPGELTLEANRENGQRLIGSDFKGRKSWVYEYWNVGDSEPLESASFGTARDAAEFLVRQGFLGIGKTSVRDLDVAELSGVLAERVLDWWTKEKPEVSITSFARLKKDIASWAGLPPPLRSSPRRG